MRRTCSTQHPVATGLLEGEAFGSHHLKEHQRQTETAATLKTARTSGPETHPKSTRHKEITWIGLADLKSDQNKAMLAVMLEKKAK